MNLDEPDLIITDTDVREHLTDVGLDPLNAPYSCAMAVSLRWELPLAEAAIMVSNLR